MKMQKNPMARQLKAMLLMKDVKYGDIAKIARKSPTTVGIIINYYPTKKSRPIQKIIADILGVPYDELWVPNHHKAHSTRPKKGCK